MNGKLLAENIACTANKLIKDEAINQIIDIAPVVNKIVFGIYANWDGNPKTLDTDAFTINEALIAIEEIFCHEEDEMETGFQTDNSVSQIIVTQSVLYYLHNMKPTKKRVVYV